MGLSKNNNSNNEGVTFLSVRMGEDYKGRKKAILAQRCKADTPGAVQVFKADGTAATNKEGENVYRLEFDKLEGRIVKLEKHDADFGDGKKQSYLHVYVQDGADMYVLSLDRGDRYWSNFLLRLPNVDLSDGVVLQPYSIEEEGRKHPNQGISIKQGGEKVLQRWTKENSDGGPPQPTFDEDEQEWKWGKRNRWMEENIVDVIAAKLGQQAQPPAATDAPPVTQDDDGMPF